MSILKMVRHGQASAYSKNYDQLSELGYKQSYILGDYWAQRGQIFDKVFVGPLMRHKQTLEQIQKAYQDAGQPWPEVVEIHELEEFPTGAIIKKAIPALLEHENPMQEKLKAFFE